MTKRPAVIGVLTEQPAPTWWKAHRHQVFAVLGLIGGFYLGTGGNDTAPAPDRPRPAHTAPDGLGAGPFAPSPPASTGVTAGTGS